MAFLLCGVRSPQRKMHFFILGAHAAGGVGVRVIVLPGSRHHGSLGKGRDAVGVVFMMSFVGVTLLLQAHTIRTVEGISVVGVSVIVGSPLV